MVDILFQLETPLGAMEGRLDASSVLRSLRFVESAEAAGERLPTASAKGLFKQLREYFQGRRRDFDIPLAPEGTGFQKRVWAELGRIPCGATISYAELAQRLGDPRAVRAVARANALNPIAILIPCHRVIGSDGTLTGYAGGLERKARLLELEGAIAPPERRQISLFPQA